MIATVAHSNYLYESSSIQRTALVEFVLLSTSQNCTLPDSCTFDESTPCKTWQLGSRSVITNSSLPSSVTSTNGRYLYSTYPQQTSAPLQIASAIINDSFCAVSFRYISLSSLELQVVVSSLGSVWSSVEVSSFSPGGGSTTGSWLQETAEIDLQAVGIQVRIWYRILVMGFASVHGNQILELEKNWLQFLRTEYSDLVLLYLHSFPFHVVNGM